MTPPLRLAAVDVTYSSGVRAVRGADLVVEAGQCVAVIGESGCGKTTLARAALGLLPEGTAVTGSIQVGGVEVVGARPAVLRRLRGRRIGLVTQDPFASCDPLRTVGHHVAEAWTAHRMRPPPGAVVAALDRLGIPRAEARSREHPHRWSGGMLQRATIAVASAHEPPVLIADEPTSALDADRANAILATLRATPAGLLLISHDLSVVAGHADQVAVMYAGRIVEYGPASRVLAAPRHPYTAALRAAEPRPGQGLPEGLAGGPPRLDQPDAGCAFAPRCPLADARCRRELPLLLSGVACHHAVLA